MNEQQNETQHFASPEEAFEAVHSNPEVDSLLNEDLSGVDTSLPLLKPCLEDFTVVKAEVQSNEKDGVMKKSLVLTLNATKELPSTDKDGAMLPTSFPHFAYTSLTPTEKMTASKVRTNVACIAQCFGVKTVGSNGENLLGKTGKVKVTIQPERDGFPERNQFRFIPAEV